MISGVWTDVLEVIGVLAVIANGLVIGISSDFIPRLVTNTYMVLVPAAVLLTLSELDLVFHNCVINIYLQQQKCTSVSFNLLCVFLSCMAGYIINTLSIANISDERVSNDFTRIQMVTYSGINVTHCR